MTLAVLLSFTGALSAQDATRRRSWCTLPALKSSPRRWRATIRGDGAVEAGPGPHTVSPTPDLMKKLREADLFIEIGLQLELWADQVATAPGIPTSPRARRGG
jgi:hypothetical protein